MVAVLVVSGVGSIVDYRKEIEFVLRRNNADKTKLVDVTRNGKIEENVHHNELLVGDLIQLRYGM
jgi:magnesium-transporting ATPase (P-type)